MPIFFDFTYFCKQSKTPTSNAPNFKHLLNQRMKHILILIAIFLINSSAQSQEQYTRTLVDAKTGELIPFAKVLIKGNDKGIIGGADGTFIIFGLPTDSLIISATHYSEFRILVGTEKTATIQLNALVQDFSELVVTALGVKRDKRDLGFSVQTISEKDLTEVRNPNLINSMAGRIAGVQTTNGSSGVGSSSRIIIRG